MTDTKVNLKVEGMHCTNCALSITKYLQKEGLPNAKVNYIDGEVSFELIENKTREQIEKGIESLGYAVKHNHAGHHHGHDHSESGKFKFKNHWQRFLVCAIFTAPLLLHMLGLHNNLLMNPLVQLILATPVYLIGIDFFGRSAFRSALKGVPNMNVLITLGATAAYGYSLYGFIFNKGMDFLFFETAATTITLVFFGNYLEDKSIETTQTALKKLAVSQKTMANMIAFDDEHKEQIFQVESKDLHVGDLILIKSGEHVPMDCKILWGEISVNEAIVTGESIPVEKKIKDTLIGGSIVENGTVKAQVTAVGEDTVLAHILQMVKDAQTEKPPVQLMADRISAVFVPVVLSIALATVLINYFIVHQTFSESLLRSIAVLVIACPCAMGLATPAAVAVGLGRAAKNGILFKNAKSLDVFKNIKQVVFDKTGTLTTGTFQIAKYEILNTKNELQNQTHDSRFTIHDDDFKRIAYSLEKYSNHPIAKAITNNWKTKNEIRWATIEEVKGLGMKATDKEGNEYIAGSFKAAQQLTTDYNHNIYIIKNNELIGWIDVADEIRPEAKQVIQQLHQQNITTILLSGDKKEKCEAVAKLLNIDTVYSEQTPEEKLLKIAVLNKTVPTAMVGDGINDAPALAKATVGISISNASQVAIQSAQVVLMNNGLQHLPMALALGKHTYITIKGNLFWALAYNILAIPIAACGLLGVYGPTYGALIMGMSDVVLAINSVWLNWKKIL